MEQLLTAINNSKNIFSFNNSINYWSFCSVFHKFSVRLYDIYCEIYVEWNQRIRWCVRCLKL